MSKSKKYSLKEALLNEEFTPAAWESLGKSEEERAGAIKNFPFNISSKADLRRLSKAADPTNQLDFADIDALVNQKKYGGKALWTKILARPLTVSNWKKFLIDYQIMIQV